MRLMKTIMEVRLLKIIDLTAFPMRIILDHICCYQLQCVPLLSNLTLLKHSRRQLISISHNSYLIIHFYELSYLKNWLGLYHVINSSLELRVLHPHISISNFIPDTQLKVSVGCTMGDDNIGPETIYFRGW